LPITLISYQPPGNNTTLPRDLMGVEVGIVVEIEPLEELVEEKNALGLTDFSQDVVPGLRYKLVTSAKERARVHHSGGPK